MTGSTKLGNHPLPASPDDPAAAGLLKDLLELDGPQLAKQDVRISALLQKNPLDASAQSEAALLLVAMAWRENAGYFSDSRRLLCKATAHLALALAVDNLSHRQPDWNEQVADAALRVLAGRETDALMHIDALSPRADTPAEAKTWLTALRLWSTGDWRQASVDESSPLLMKIAWFQILCADLTDLDATSRLDHLGDPPKVPDWGRALMNRHALSVETENRFAQETFALELQEATEVAQAENWPLSGPTALPDSLSAQDNETIVVDATGNPTVHVIGAGTFFSASRRHLLNTMLKTDDWLKNKLGVPDEGAKFETAMNTTFEKLPLYDVVALQYPGPNKMPRPKLDEVLRARNARWEITDLPPTFALSDFSNDAADERLLNDFYLSDEPCGTVYDFLHRRDMLELLRIPPRWHLANDAQTPDQISEVKRDYLQQLQLLNPDSCPLVEEIILSDHGIGTGENGQQAIAALSRFMDYDVSPFHMLRYAQPDFDLSDADLETIYRKEALLEPETYFALGQLLRKEGRDDDAAEADRKGAAQAFDHVLIANSVEPLVDYDLTHGKTDEALALAKSAADVYSEQGILTYIEILQKLNRLDEAETWAKNLQDRYDDNQALISLYAAHPDHFQNQADALKKKNFPEGQVSVSINSFSGPPAGGAVFTSINPLLTNSGLETGDVIVALNSIKVENLSQYYYVRAQTSGNDMDLIVWHDHEYREIDVSPPDHRFGVGMSDYPVR
jgi:hypothetical protein